MLAVQSVCVRVCEYTCVCASEPLPRLLCCFLSQLIEMKQLDYNLATLNYSNKPDELKITLHIELLVAINS